MAERQIFLQGAFSRLAERLKLYQTSAKLFQAPRVFTFPTFAVGVPGSQVRFAGTKVGLPATPVRFCATQVAIPGLPVAFPDTKVGQSGSPVGLPNPPVALSAGQK